MTLLKIDYVSPLPPVRSGIADYSRDLLPHLSPLCDLRVIGLMSQPMGDGFTDQWQLAEAAKTAHAAVKDAYDAAKAAVAETANAATKAAATKAAVAEAAAIGIPHERKGEQVVLCISLREGEKVSDSDMKDYCRKNLPPFMAPDIIKIYPTLPKNATGKVLKTKLREQAIPK